MNAFFEKIYEPLPVDYNLILAMLWRHPENFDFDKVKIFHYCAAVSPLPLRQSSPFPLPRWPLMAASFSPCLLGFQAVEVHGEGGEHG